jgi:hypothetical protein
MADQLTGVAIPIEFRTNKLKPPITRHNEARERTVQVRGPRPVMGSMELYFSRHRVAPDDVDFAEPGKQWIKERTLYQKHNLHGEHQFLVPSSIETIESDRYIWATKDRFAFGLVNGSPTTATGTETLQLVPCDQLNLELFLDKLQSQPFYIEVAGTDFALHVKDNLGGYRKLACHPFTPRCWHGSRHAVITTQRAHTYQPILRLETIPWTEIAELGVPV